MIRGKEDLSKPMHRLIRFLLKTLTKGYTIPILANQQKTFEAFDQPTI